MFRRACGGLTRVLFYFAREAAGAFVHRHSLCPLIWEGFLQGPVGGLPSGNLNARHCEERQRRNNPAFSGSLRYRSR
jgi:hypothetical protein